MKMAWERDSDYAHAVVKTLDHEGGFVDHPDDRGGMTYMGITRKYHPDWIGWTMIDEHGPRVSDNFLKASILQLYYDEYWLKSRCDFLAQYSPRLARHVFDAAVHHGTRRAIKLLQQALNVLNRGGSLWHDIPDQGYFPKDGLTEEVVRQAHSREFMDDVVLMLKAYRVSFMLGIAESDPSQESFIKGWIRRVLK